MKLSFCVILLVLLITSCGGQLNDEQRKKLKERMKNDEIMHVSEGELMSAAFAYGRKIDSLLEMRDPSMANGKFLDSLESAYNVKIAAIQPGDSLLLAIESKLIEAYASSAGEVNVADDIQKIGNDSILYTKPIMHERPDGTVEFMKALSIHMPVKSVILSIAE